MGELWPLGPEPAAPARSLTAMVVGDVAGWRAEALELMSLQGLTVVDRNHSDAALDLIIDFDSPAGTHLAVNHAAANSAPVGRFGTLRWSFAPTGDGRQGVSVALHRHRTAHVLARGICPVLPHSTTRTRALAEAAAVGLSGPAIRRIPESPGQLAKLPSLPESEPRPPTPGPAPKPRGRLGRLLFGAVYERSWRVGFLDRPIDPETYTTLQSAQLDRLEPPTGVRYIADPLVGASSLCVEGYSSRTGLGELFAHRDGQWTRMSPGPRGHYSYPFVVFDAGVGWLLPEMAFVGPQRIFRMHPQDGPSVRTSPRPRLEDHSGTGSRELLGLAGLRLIDATPFECDGHWYLFAGAINTQDGLPLGDVAVRLFVASEVQGPYTEHPASPVLVDADGARMAGPILESGGYRYRPGQVNSTRYGDGVLFHRIERLTPEHYEEVRCGGVAFADARGPHTVSATESGVWLDWYDEKATPVAGWHRLLWRVAAWRQRSRS